MLARALLVVVLATGGERVVLAADRGSEASDVEAISLPGGEGGIGFDDLVYSRALKRVVVPAGRTGRLDLIEPGSRAVESIDGFSASSWRSPGHGQGTTSADVGAGYVFATDRSRKTLDVVDPQQKRIVAQVPLSAGPDYVRWVEAAREVWVTEPGRDRIEVFHLERELGSPPRLTPVGAIAVPDGPESLVFDAAGKRAYTNTFGDTTMAVDVSSRAVVARWKNQCRGARGIALDPARGAVFVGCDEGKVVALDAQDGRVLGEARTGGGVDSIGYSATLAHVYAPGGDSATLTIVGMGERGELKVLGTAPTARGAHCVAPDEDGGVYVCDPGGGRVLKLRDVYPAGARASPGTGLAP